MNNDSILIKQIKDSLKGKLFCCPFNDCGSGLSNNGTDVSFYHHDRGYVQCLCPKCNNRWFLCRTCGDLGKTVHPLLSFQAIRSHNYRLHKESFHVGNTTKKRKKVRSSNISNNSCKDTTAQSSEVLEPDNYEPANYVLGDESDIQRK